MTFRIIGEPSGRAVTSKSVGTAIFCLCLLASWMLMHRYGGIRHDAGLYTMQGLAHLHPGQLDSDIYLRYGSQDRFTVFGPVYAAAIRVLGLDHSAALLTLLSQALFACGAYIFGVGLMTPRLALLGVGLVFVSGGAYGSSAIFHVIEDFVTPRLAAESLVLLGIAAFLADRRAIALLSLVLAILIHPIMACAGVVLMLWLARPRLAVLCLVGAVAGMFAAALSGTLARMDGDWLDFITTAVPYLRVSSWKLADWSAVFLPACILVIGSIVLVESRTRTLLSGSLVLLAAGPLFTAIGADWLHLAIVTQAQPWRWQWLAETIAMLSLPLSVPALWKGSSCGRTAVLLLIAAHLFQGALYSFPVGVMAILATVYGIRPQAAAATREFRLVFWGAGALLAFALAYAVGNALLVPAQNSIDIDVALPVYRKVIDALGIAPLVISGLWLLTRSQSRPILSVLAVSGATCCALLLPSAASAWTRIEYSRSSYDAFASWRRLIPPGTEVLTPDDPLLAWVMLERPSYFTSSQALSGVFSRAAVLADRQRSVELQSFISLQSIGFPARDGSDSVIALCARTHAHYIATRTKDELTPIATVPSNISPRFAGFRLFRCGDASSIAH